MKLLKMNLLRKKIFPLAVALVVFVGLGGCIPSFTPDGASDLNIEGEITQYYLTPQAVTEDAYASRTRLTIGVRVKYTDNKAEGKDVDQTFTAYRDFDSSQMLTDVQDQLCQEISEELVQLIFNATLGNW